MKNKIGWFTLIGLVLGILGGLLCPDLILSLSFVGTIYVNLLKFMIIPVIFTSIMVTIYNSRKQKGKIIFKTIVLFMCMFVITFLLTSLIVGLFKPGIGFNFDVISWGGDVTSFNFSDIIVGLFPSNIITMIENNSIFSTIVLAFLCGITASKVKNGKEVIDVVEGIKNISYKILEYIMYITPVAVISLLGTTIATYGTSIIKMGGVYVGFAYICSIIALVVVMIMPVSIYAKISPLTYIKKLLKVWTLTFTTCSSAATLPTTIKVCNEDLNVPNKITDIVVPLGCTIHMCGGAVSFALLGIFCSQLFGIEISFLTFLLMISSATLINMAAPGIPGGGVVIGASYLSLLGIPISFIGFYSGIYKILDMIYTTLNVTGDVSANVLICSAEKK